MYLYFFSFNSCLHDPNHSLTLSRLKTHLPVTVDDDDRRDGCESTDADCGVDESDCLQRDRSWTPEPETYDPEQYAAWGRKHSGEDLYEQYEALFRERDSFKTEKCQETRRQLEREKERRKPVGKRNGVKEIRTQPTYIASTAAPSGVLPLIDAGCDAAPLLPNDSEHGDISSWYVPMASRIRRPLSQTIHRNTRIKGRELLKMPSRMLSNGNVKFTNTEEETKKSWGQY